jgi:hypothetical protein
MLFWKPQASFLHSRPERAVETAPRSVGRQAGKAMGWSRSWLMFVRARKNAGRQLHVVMGPEFVFGVLLARCGVGGICAGV